MRQKKIIDFKEAIEKSKELRAKDQVVILVGGVFDILHFGHIHFLQQAKKYGDVLFVALEPDVKVKKLKGVKRPIHREKIRAYMLSALSCVDYVFILPELVTNKAYQDMVKTIQPNVIAVTDKDPFMEEKRRHAEVIGGKLSIVAPKIPTPSTTQLVKLLALE